MSVDPPPSPWVFPPPESAGDEDVVAVGADLEPGTLLAAYRAGLFPMPVGGHLAWFSPDPRGVIERFHCSRSLRRSRRRFEIRVDTAFTRVIDACGDRHRPAGWITPRMRRAYVRLHDLGWAHSVEAWSPDGLLAGGLYGVQIGGLFAAESMFHEETDAGKAALAWLAEQPEVRLLDVQWLTPHLESLGAVEITRAEYLRRLSEVL